VCVYVCMYACVYLCVFMLVCMCVCIEYRRYLCGRMLCARVVFNA